MIDDSTPVMAYLAACTLWPQTTYATLDIQSAMLVPSPSPPSVQPWNLWSSNIQAAEFANFTASVSQRFLSCIVYNLII